VLLVDFRRLAFGLSGVQYINQAMRLYMAWLTSITENTMSSTIPGGVLKDVIVRDFGHKILNDHVNVTVAELKDAKDYVEKI
jgi:hypothetical protein